VAELVRESRQQDSDIVPDGWRSFSSGMSINQIYRARSQAGLHTAPLERSDTRDFID